MTPAQKQAIAWIKQGVSERVDELTDRWQAEQDAEERERLHAAVRATIELEDHLSARIREYTAG